MVKIPETKYEYDIEKLVAAYKRAAADILDELERTDTSSLSSDLAAKQLAEISEQLSVLNAESASWVEKNIPEAARNGAAAAILALGTAKTMEEARKLAKFGSLNEKMVKSVIADTQEDLLAVTNNMERRIRNAVRSASANVLRRNMAAGINGHRTNKREILEELRANLGDALNTGIVDAAGRRWKPETYVDMLVRTKMMYAHNEATRNEALERNVMYATISRHGAKDACSKWEGRVVKLVPDAPGDYPTLDAAKSSKQIFHPNCKHVITPIRNPDGILDDEAEAQPAKVPTHDYVKGRALSIDQDTPIIKNTQKDFEYLFDDGRFSKEGDPLLQELFKAQKFHGKPEIVSEKDLDDYVKAGERELYRGLTDATFVDQFMNGDLYAGFGVYGNGTYTAYGEKAVRTAAEYATENGAAMRMTLRKDAKVAKYHEIREEAIAETERLTELMSSASDDNKLAELAALQTIASDIGRYATSKGYDAVDVEAMEYLVVLNRTALRVQDKTFTGREINN